MATIPITKRGAEKLKAELHKLKTVDRPWVINAIAEARAQGDLSENAEYDAAKDRQGFIEGRIQEIEGKLSAAQVIDPSSATVPRIRATRASARHASGPRSPSSIARGGRTGRCRRGSWRRASATTSAGERCPR